MLSTEVPGLLEDVAAREDEEVIYNIVDGGERGRDKETLLVFSQSGVKCHFPVDVGFLAQVFVLLPESND